MAQIHQFSQNHNRYSYVLNNTLNLTDPTGYSWLSKAFHKIGHWFKQNWRTVVSIVVGVALFFILGPAGGYGYNLLGNAFGISSNWAVGGIIGAATGATNAALSGGSLGDVLKGAVIGGISGAIAGECYMIWAKLHP